MATGRNRCVINAKNNQSADIVDTATITGIKAHTAGAMPTAHSKSSRMTSRKIALVSMGGGTVGTYTTKK